MLRKLIFATALALLTIGSAASASDLSPLERNIMRQLGMAEAEWEASRRAVQERAFQPRHAASISEARQLKVRGYILTLAGVVGVAVLVLVDYSRKRVAPGTLRLSSNYPLPCKPTSLCAALGAIVFTERKRS
jgi:hypothetical protein